MPFNYRDIRPMLKCKNLDETIEFYTSELGFKLVGRVEHWCSLHHGDRAIMFYDENEHQPEAPQMTGVIYFYPDDVKALWEMVKDKVKVEWELQTMPYEMVEFAFRDINGYILAFGQDAAEVPEPLPPRHEE